MAAIVRLGQGFGSLLIWLTIVVQPVAIPVIVVSVLAARVRTRYLARQAAASNHNRASRVTM